LAEAAGFAKRLRLGSTFWEADLITRHKIKDTDVRGLEAGQHPPKEESHVKLAGKSRCSVVEGMKNFC